LQLPACPPSDCSKASAQVQEHGVTVRQATEAQDDRRVIIIGFESQEHDIQGNPLQVDSQSQDDQHKTNAALINQYITHEELLTLDPTYNQNVVCPIAVAAVNNEMTRAEPIAKDDGDHSCPTCSSQKGYQACNMEKITVY
jgi:hypothetical protein